MAPKGRGGTPGPTSASSTTVTSTSSSRSSQSQLQSPLASLETTTRQVWAKYVDETPQRTKLLDLFLAFLLVVGAVQFVYCILFGNYPFNAFLAGFGATVGQFVLTCSLRMQTTPVNAKEFPAVSPERAFADFVMGSLILHFFCVNFVN